MAELQREDQIAGIAALAEPQRRALYRYVVSQHRLVSRDEAGSAVGLPRHVAAFHLDRLEEDGLLETEFRRPPGRSGPGAGRPAKYYRRSAREWEVSLPERRYAFGASLMAKAIGRASREAIPVADALREAATTAGHTMGKEARARSTEPGSEGLDGAFETLLDEFGYETVETDGLVTLENCPFRALADQDTELVCGMNLDFLSGALAEIPEAGMTASLEPAPGRCCVTMRRR
jgi:predicted ArsR family transcriptional regulator